MAVEARHLNLFPSQLIGNREMMSGIEGNLNVYNNNNNNNNNNSSTPFGYGLPPLSGTTTTTETLFPMYNSSAITDSLPAQTTMKADSGLTYVLPRKRSRDDSIHPLISFPNVHQILNQNQNQNNRCDSFTFLGEDISSQIQQQQSEIDRFIAQHTEKVRLEVEERRKQYSRRIIAAVEEGMRKRLRAKEDEIDKIGKLNWALGERVKSLCIENQIWKELAQTNEATANALRINLEQVLASQVNDDQHHHRHGGGDEIEAALMDDAESCCGSNDDNERRSLEGCGGERKVVKDNNNCNNNDDCTTSSSSGQNNSNRLCRHCGKEEPCVLLLPCRHLCLCTVCGSSVHTCPICNTPKNASVHVIIS